MTKKTAQQAFEQVKARIFDSISENLENLNKSELNKSLFGLPSSTPPVAQVQKDVGLPVQSVFSVLSLGKGENNLEKMGTMSHMMAVGTKKNKPPVKVLKGDRSPKPKLQAVPTPAPAASPVVAAVKKGKAKKAPAPTGALGNLDGRQKAPVAANQNPDWASQLGVQPAAAPARTSSVPSALKMSHGDYRIQANADGSSSLLYTKKHKSPIMNLIFGSKPKDLGRFSHRAQAYDSLLGHHDQVSAGLIKEEEGSDSNSEQSAQVDPDSVHDMEPVLSRAKENVPNQEHCDSEELSAPGSGGMQSAKKTNKALSKAAGDGAAGTAPAAPTTAPSIAPAMPKPLAPITTAPAAPALPKPSGMVKPVLAPMPKLKTPEIAGKQGYAYEVENQPTAIAAPQAPTLNAKRGAAPQAIEQGGTGNNWIPGQKFQGRSLNINTLKNEMPTGPVQGAGAVTGDNALDKSVYDPNNVGPGNAPKLSNDMKGIKQTAQGPKKPEFTTSSKDGISQTKPLGKTSMSPTAAAAKNAKMPTQQQIKPNIPGLIKAAEDLTKEFEQVLGCKKCGSKHSMKKGCH